MNNFAFFSLFSCSSNLFSVVRCNCWVINGSACFELWCMFLCGSGYGGGFMERDEVVEYVERDDSEDEFDEVIQGHVVC